MGDVITLRNTAIDVNSDEGHRFVVDATRAGEGLISDRELAEKWELSPADFQNIAKDAALGRAIRAERERRMLNGTAARESAAKHLVKGPGILDGIMTDAGSNPRHKIEAHKELRATAAVGSNNDRPGTSEMFLIKIDLSSDGQPHIETYEKNIKIDVSDGDNLIGGKSNGDDQW